jgi:dihydroorotate dehydrogenase (fumarate)
LNLYEVLTDPGAPAAAVERQLAGIVREVKRILRIPVAVKVTPYFTAFANMARQFEAAGADALVLFNRFLQTDINIETMRIEPRMELSTSNELLLRLHWLAILYGRISPSLAVTGGIDQPEDGIKAILCGADAVQMVSALLRYGSAHVQEMRRGLEQWMERHEFSSVDEMRGQASFKRTLDADAAERAGYIRTLQCWGKEIAWQRH